MVVVRGRKFRSRRDGKQLGMVCVLVVRMLRLICMS